MHRISFAQWVPCGMSLHLLHSHPADINIPFTTSMHFITFSKTQILLLIVPVYRYKVLTYRIGRYWLYWLPETDRWHLWTDFEEDANNDFSFSFSCRIRQKWETSQYKSFIIHLSQCKCLMRDTNEPTVKRKQSFEMAAVPSCSCWECSYKFRFCWSWLHWKCVGASASHSLLPQSALYVANGIYEYVSILIEWFGIA